jgi:hypothetical protein
MCAAGGIKNGLQANRRSGIVLGEWRGEGRGGSCAISGKGNRSLMMVETRTDLMAGDVLQPLNRRYRFEWGEFESKRLRVALDVSGLRAQPTLKRQQ